MMAYKEQGTVNTIAKEIEILPAEHGPLDVFLALLSPAERFVAECRVFKKQEERASLESLGKVLNVTRERVRLIEKSVIEYFNEYKKAKDVADNDAAIILLPIPRKYKTRLINRGFHKLSDLLPLNEDELLAIPGIGPKTLEELKKGMGLQSIVRNTFAEGSPQ
jgi:DNA-directed RNA polymerase alpha subunit